MGLEFILLLIFIPIFIFLLQQSQGLLLLSLLELISVLIGLP